MDSFFGNSSSKSSLQDTVRSQQDRLAKYEKKLSDLVKAYKVLQEEKKALQETVNVLSSKPVNQICVDGAPCETSGYETLRQQVTALTKSIASLNDNKNTLESRFQNDKKELLENIETLNDSLSFEKTSSLNIKQECEVAINTLKKKLRHEQNEREQEQTHHVAMLRELQHMLAAERNTTQKLELDLDEIRSNQRNYNHKEFYTEKINVICKEKDNLQRELTELKSKFAEPSKAYKALEEEVLRFREIQRDLELNKKSDEETVYKQLHLQSNADQSRIRDLENRLTEVSELIADYDSRQKQDQDKITRLQKRVTTLESDNQPQQTKYVNVSVNTNVIIDGGCITPTSASVVPPEGCTNNSISLLQTPSHFTQPVFSSLASKNRETEIAKLKDTLRVCRQEIQTLQEEKKVLHQNLVKATEQHKSQLEELAVQHSLEISELDKGHTLRLSELQESSKKARLRSQALLEEREEELRAFTSKGDNNRPDTEEKDESMMSELLISVHTDNIPRTLVFYKHQYKYLSDELLNVKKTKETLEQSMREKERNEHVYVYEISELKKEIRRLLRNRSRESANLEYLKNIILRYLRATSSSEKRQILLAIFTVLEFSEEEKTSVKHKLAPAWFS